MPAGGGNAAAAPEDEGATGGACEDTAIDGHAADGRGDEGPADSLEVAVRVAGSGARAS
jgi:hypothetical protein